MLQIVRMINIQSYKDITFNLSGRVNVLDAPNETGKSIMFKVFRTMCDANWYGRGERKSLIRRGSDKGTALLVVPYSDGVFRIVFEIYKTYQVYHLFDGDEKVDSWKQDSIPDDLLNILGWYYDKDSKVLLNLCDQELDMPFVNSNSRFNYEVMRFIIQNPELETAKNNLQVWIKRNTDEIEDLSLKCRTLEGIIADYKYVDTTALEQSINVRDEAAKKGRVLVSLISSLKEISSLEEPKIARCDSNKVEQDIKIAEHLRQLGLTLQNAMTLNKPNIKTADTASVENKIQISTQLSSLGYKLLQIRNILDDMNSVRMKLQNAIEIKEDFEMENEVCPLCGNTFNNHECK